MRHLGIAAFFVCAIVLAVTVSYSAQAPSPSRDLEPLFHGNRPGCDQPDFKFEVCNLSASFDYVVRMAGGVKLSSGYSVPKTCCEGSGCVNSFKNEEQVVLAGGCTNGSVMSTPQFPECEASCDCDNDVCSSTDPTIPWCAVIVNPVVTVTQWKYADEETWTVYESPVALCHWDIAGKQCPAESACD